jgi:WD40 repeat protein
MMSNTEEQKALHFSAPSNRAINSIDFSSDGKLLAIGQQSGQDKSSTLSIFNVDSGELVNTLEKTISHAGSIYKVAFAPHNNQLAYVRQRSEDFQLKIYDFDRKKTKVLARDDEPLMQGGLAFDASGKYLMVSGRKIKLLDAKTYKLSKTISTQKANKETTDDTNIIISAAISPDGKYVAVGGEEKERIVIFDVTDSSVSQRLAFPFKAVDHIGFDISGQHIAAMDYYGNGLYMWDIRTGQRYLEEVFNDDMPPIYSMRFSHSTRHLALGLVNSYVILYDLTNGEELLTDHLHRGRVTDVCFSPDGKILVSAGEDNQIFIRHLTGRET